VSDYFKRQIELWGREAQERLGEKSVAIIGCGGLGSSLALALGSSGIGRIYLVDFDRVSLHNIHRQISFSLGDEGEPKAEVNARRVRERYDGVAVESFVEGFQEFRERRLPVDLLIDGTDNLPVRLEIDRYAKELGVPWIYGSVEEFHAQVCFMERASFQVFRITERTPRGITAPMVMLTASFQANLALRYLVGLPIERDTLYYLHFDRGGGFRVERFLMPKD